MKVIYHLFVEKSADGFCGWFPELPGCTTAADTFEQLPSAAAEAASLHLEGDAHVPEPRSFAELWTEEEDKALIFSVIPIALEVDGAFQRLQVSLPASLVARIDTVAKNRSGFLADAAREKLARMHTA